MRASQQQAEGYKVFKPKDIMVVVIKAQNDMLLQVGDGLRQVKAGDFIITLPSGQQFPLAPTSLDGLFDGVSRE